MKYIVLLCVFIILLLKAVLGQATPSAMVMPTVEQTPEPPSVSTGPALNITAHSAYLVGSVFNKYKSGTAWFEYGFEGTFNNSTIPETLPDYGVADMMNLIDGLLSETSYSFRLVAENDAGITYEEVDGFTTLSETITPSQTPTPTLTPSLLPLPSLHHDCPSCGISGTVKDATTGVGIEKAVISIDNETVLTGEDGNYSWWREQYFGPCEGEYTLTASADGYKSVTQSIRFDNDNDPCEKELNFELPVCDSPCVVTGKVVDIETKRGIKNTIIVNREGWEGPEISSTGTDGTYYWSDSQIPCWGDTKTLTASAYGYIPQSKEVTVGNCIEATLDFELKPSKIPRPIILVAPERITLYFVSVPSGEIIVMVLGKDGLLTGKMIKAKINGKGKRLISVTPTRQITDENGEAKFTVTTKGKKGNARIKFEVGKQKKILIVKIK